MADISKIKLNNVEYNIKDASARSLINALNEQVDTKALNLELTGNSQTQNPPEALVTLKDSSNGPYILITCSNGDYTYNINIPCSENKEISFKEDSFSKVYYNSSSTPPQIEFYSDNTVFNAGIPASGSTPICTLDASAFIKDAMVSSVAIDNGNLVITWNTDSGISTPTSIPLTSIFDPTNYYDKDDIDNLIEQVELGQLLFDVTYNTTNKQLEKTVNGTTTTVVTSSTIVTDGGGYKKPSDGIPKTDLANAVQTSLSRADTAIQGIKVNGSELLKDNTKKVDITIPTSLADLSSDNTHRLVTDTEKTTWNNKQDALIFDTTPTESSTNPVTSGGLYTSLLLLTSAFNTALEDVIEDVTYNSSTRLLSKKFVGESTSTGVVILPTATYSNEVLEIVLASTPS